MAVESLLQALAADREAVLISVAATQGSVPREAGTWMAVFADNAQPALIGTIGGGQLEHRAIARARAALADPQALTEPELQRCPLGPSLGQCCGGVVELRYERVGAADVVALKTRLMQHFTPVAVFGGGHVGRALVQVLSSLPFEVTWIDSRDGIFPDDVPLRVACEHSDPVQAGVGDLRAGCQVLIMSFSHAEDLDIVAACLRRRRERGDLPFIGLIGSRTKWATFRHRLTERGFAEDELAAVTCPIGLPGIEGKEPEVIAVAVAAQLLGLRR